MIKSISFTVMPLFLILALYGCNKENLQTSNANVAVVEGYLYSGRSVSIHVTKQINTGSSDGTIYPIDTLHVFLTNGSDTITLANATNGYYKSDPAFLIQQGQTYSLLFNFNGKMVSSSTKVPTPPTNVTQSVTQISLAQINTSSGPPSSFTQPDPVKIRWSNSDLSYYLIVVKDTDSNPEAVFSSTDTSVTKPTFLVQPTQGNSYDIQSARFNYFGHTEIILFHINAEYAALYNSQGSSSQNLTEPATNIINGTGIFTGINSDTLYLLVKKS